MVRNNVNASAKKLPIAGVVDPGYSLYSGSSFDASYISASARPGWVADKHPAKS
jgi:hypothetical protein